MAWLLDHSHKYDSAQKHVKCKKVYSYRRRRKGRDLLKTFPGGIDLTAYELSDSESEPEYIL